MSIIDVDLFECDNWWCELEPLIKGIGRTQPEMVITSTKLGWQTSLRILNVFLSDVFLVLIQLPHLRLVPCHFMI